MTSECEDGYVFRPEDLASDDEELRGWAIMAVSRRSDRRYERELLHLLDNDPSEANRRHVVRALGNLNSKAAAPKLLELLDSGEGLNLGDVAEALGKMCETRARERLLRLRDSNVDWVRNKSRWALGQLDD